jgi:hypothetical protein
MLFWNRIGRPTYAPIFEWQIYLAEIVCTKQPVGRKSTVSTTYVLGQELRFVTPLEPAVEYTTKNIR